MDETRGGPLDSGRLRSRLAAGHPSIGTFAGLAAPMAAEVVASAGAEWVVLDLEHGGASDDQIGPTVVAAGAWGAATIVRVETPERIRIGRALDAGAAGVMLPRLSSAAETAAALEHMRYPPAGDRGVATYNRAISWGADLPALASASRNTLGVVQIETTGALAEVEQIAGLDGADVLFVGPLDLSYALGMPRDFDAPAFTDALDRVVAAAAAHGKTAGVLATTSAAAQDLLRRGFRFVAIGSDSTLLAAATRQAIAAARDEVST